LEGIIKSAADVRPEAIRATYECPECKHQMIIPQITRKLAEPYVCDNPTCGRKGKFKLTSTDLVDSQKLRVQEPPETLVGGEQPSQLYVQLADDLVAPKERRKVMPGNRVKICGIVRKIPVQTPAGAKTTRFDLFMDGNHVKPIEREFEEIELDKKDIAEIKKLAKDPEIYEKLVRSVAPSIYGYDDVKEAILFQLFGGVPKVQPDGTKIRGNIHIFLLGDPAVGKSQMLWYVSGLSPKGRFVSGKKASGVGLTAAVVKDDFAGGWTLEAGALILANNGIACVDEFDKMEPDDRSAMLEAMEQGTISVAKAGIVTTLRANTSVLAAANPKYGRFDSYRPIVEQIDLSPVILSRFDLKFPIKDIPDKRRDKELVEHVLDSFVTPKSIEPEIPTEFIRKYIAYAKTTCQPTLTAEAKREIKNFYLEWRSRYVGEGESQTVALTPRQLEALVRMAEASAKVRLSSKATIDDAKRATRLLELSLKLLGTEPETGKIDIDRIDAGTSAVKRSKIHTMLKIIEDLTEQIGTDVPLEDIVKEASERGIEKTAAMEFLEEMKKKGDLYESKPGHLKAV
jgi:replicative DNA helicase Mcm